MNFRKRLLVIITVPLGVCLTLILALFFVGSDMSKKTSQIEKLRGDLLFQTGLTDSLAILNQQAETAKSYEATLQNILPSRDQLIAFPKNIVSIAKQNKFNLNTTLGQGEYQDSEELQQTNFTISGQGSFEGFVVFLKTLENGQYFIKFKTIDIAKQEKDFGLLMTGGVFSF